MWKLAACIDGVNYANNPEEKFDAPTDQEFDQMLLDYDHLRVARPN